MKFLKELISFIFSLAFLKQIIIATTIILSLILLFAITIRKITKHGEFIIVPDITNKNYGASTKILSDAQLKYKTTFIYKPSISPGTIFEQTPRALTKVKSGQTIYLTVTSTEIPNIQMPSIEGLSLYEATNILKNENISISSIEYTPDIEKNVVLRVKYNDQLLKQGDSIPMFSSVVLVLGDGFGKNIIAVPNLTGLTLKEALFSIRGYGILLGKVINDSPDSSIELEQLKVYKQYPEPYQGATLNQGDKIDIYLK